MAKQIGQRIIKGSDLPETISKNNIQSFSVQALPGCVIQIDGSEITLGPAGLLNVDIPVREIVVPIGKKDIPEDKTNESLLTGANTQMVIDYIYEDNSGGEQTDG